MKKVPPEHNPYFENRRAIIITVIAAALIVRVIFLLQYYHTVFWYAVWSDSGYYNQWARRMVVNHDWLGSEPFFMTPLYPYFLALTYSVFGQDLLIVRILQNLAGVATVLCVFLVGEKLFSRKVGFAAGIIASAYGPFILSNNLILVETLKVFFLVMTLLLLLVARDKKHAGWWLAPGLTTGLAILCRPTDFLVVVVAALWTFLFIQKSAKEKVVRLTSFIAGVILLVAPVTLRNYLVSNEFILITSNGGLNFYLGNNPQAVGVYYNVDQLDLANDPDGRVYLETVFNKILKPSEVSSYWFSRAADFAVHQPLDLLQLLIRKAILFFHHKEISQLGYNYQFIYSTSVPLLSFLPSFIIIGPLAVVGCFIARKRWKELFLLYGILFAEFVGVIAFFVTDRFRLSAIPFMILFAGLAVVQLYERWQERRWKELHGAIVILVAAVLLTTVINYDIPDEFSTEYEYIGLTHFSARQYNEAMRAFNESLRYRNTFHIHNNIGNVFLAQRNVQAAIVEYAIGHSMNPRQAISYFNIGTAYVTLEDWESALRAFEKSIQINPRFEPAYLNKGLTLYFMQRYPEALKFLLFYTELEKDKSKLATVFKDIEKLKNILQQQSK